MDTLHIVAFSVAAVLGAAVVALLKRDVKDVEIAIHKWAGSVATALAKAGLSTTLVTPLQDLAAGDDDGALGSGIAAAEYLKDAKNVEKEVLSIVQTALADPVLGPKVKQFCSDVASGASAATLQTDADAITSASPLASSLKAANSTLDHSLEQIETSALHPDLTDLVGLLPPGTGVLSKLIRAGKAVGQRAANAAASAAKVSPADSSAPAAAPAAAANSTTVTAPSTHGVTVTPPAAS